MRRFLWWASLLISTGWLLLALGESIGATLYARTVLRQVGQLDSLYQASLNQLPH